MKQLHSKDAWMTFETNGIPPLFQFLVCDVYLPPGNILIYDGKTWREFIFADLLPQLNEEGKRLYHGESILKKAYETIVENEATTFELCDRILKLNEVPWELVEELMDRSRVFVENYRYFDTWFSDGAYQNRDDAQTARGLDYAAATKNVIREKLNVLFFENDKAFPAALGHIAELHGSTQEDMLWYLPTEVKGLCEGNPVPTETLAARRRGYVYMVDTDSSISLIEGTEAEDYIHEFDSDKIMGDAVESLKGMTAHGKGKIQGKVRVVVADYIDFSKTEAAMAQMQEGEVMVSTTTAPDVLPAMKKAAAIVTDLGGMLSHAAITARELDIPCLVGTKLATQVFKDGDEVEVDLEAGTIRRL